MFDVSKDIILKKRSNNFEISVVFEGMQVEKMNILTDSSSPVLFVSPSSFKK